MPIIADVSAASGPTLSELVTELVNLVQGYSISPDRVLVLKNAASSTDLTLVLESDGVSDITPGVYEVDDELVYVTATDPTTGSCTVHPRGRGWLGSVAAAHSAGALVTVSPSLARDQARRAINDAVSSLYPTIFGVGTVTTDTTDSWFVELPADAEFVLDVRRLDADGEWQRVRAWEAEMSSAFAASTTKAVRLPGTCQGTTVQVVYAARPEPLAAADQQFSETGLSPGCKEAVLMLALAKVAQVIDFGRLSDRFATARGDSQQPQITSGFQMSRALRADAQAAVDREAVALRHLYPARQHFVR